VKRSTLVSLLNRAPRLIVVAYFHLKRSFSHLSAVVTLACSISACCCLLQPSVFLDYRALSLKALFHLFGFSDYFFSTGTALL